MKDFKKASGWLYKCQGGPLDNQHIRGYNQIKQQGEWVEGPLDWEFCCLDNAGGRYILKPLTLATGERRKAKHKGIEYDGFFYEWETT